VQTGAPAPNHFHALGAGRLMLRKPALTRSIHPAGFRNHPPGRGTGSVALYTASAIAKALRWLAFRPPEGLVLMETKTPLSEVGERMSSEMNPGIDPPLMTSEVPALVLIAVSHPRPRRESAGGLTLYSGVGVELHIN